MNTVFIKTSTGEIIQTPNPEAYLYDGGKNPTMNEILEYLDRKLYLRGAGNRQFCQNPQTINTVGRA